MTEKEFSIMLNDVTARGAVLNLLLIVAVLLILITFVLLWLLDLKLKQVKPKSRISAT